MTAPTLTDARPLPADRGGVLALVVGPSGAGKDTLIATAREQLRDDPRFVFVRRTITRAVADPTEAHAAITPEAFADAEQRGDFLLSWRAHDLGYGIPVSAAADIAAGRTVIANVSRGVIGTAERRLPRVVVLHITAPIDVLAHRIAARGRESAADVAQRLARQAPLTAERAPIIEIVNDGPVASAAERFVEALKSLAMMPAGIAR